MNTDERIAHLFGTGPTTPKGPPGLPTPSPQQEAILNATLLPGQSLKVESGAGSGKTTSMVMFSWKQGPSARLLYICFSNKGAAEARASYQAAGIRNTRICTVHALAGETKAAYEKAGKFQTKITIKDIQKHHPVHNPHSAWEVIETLKLFCESDKLQPGPEHVPELPGMDPIKRQRIVSATARVWENMRNPEHPAPLSFDHYLKIFDLANPKLAYDYILVDEAQDSNPLTLSILRKQLPHSRIILIGDSHQGIYKWRGAQDAMKDWETPRSLQLTESYRFGKNIAMAANAILKTFCAGAQEIVGKKPTDALGPVRKDQKHTLIARTNASLFEEALVQVVKGRRFHFVGTRAETNWDPSGPYKFDDARDVLSLYIGDRKAIRNPHIQAFDSYKELKAAAEGVNGQGGDKELESLCKVVERYKHNLPGLIRKIVQNCCGPAEADILFVTCHRSKGLEWPKVRMADDFAPLVITNEETQQEQLAPIGIGPGETDPEEINLIYVAITRAKDRLEPNPKTATFFRRVDLHPPGINAPIIEAPEKRPAYREAPDLPGLEMG